MKKIVMTMRFYKFFIMVCLFSFINTCDDKKAFLDEIKEQTGSDIVLNNGRTDIFPGTIIKYNSGNYNAQILYQAWDYIDYRNMNENLFTLTKKEYPLPELKRSIRKDFKIELKASEANGEITSDLKFNGTAVLSNGRSVKSELGADWIKYDARYPRFQNKLSNINFEQEKSLFVVTEAIVYDIDIQFNSTNGMSIGANLNRYLMEKLRAEAKLEDSFVQIGKNIVVSVNGYYLHSIEERKPCSANQFRIRWYWNCAQLAKDISYGYNGWDHFFQLGSRGRIDSTMTLNKDMVSNGHFGVCPSFEGPLKLTIEARSSDKSPIDMLLEIPVSSNEMTVNYPPHHSGLIKEENLFKMTNNNSLVWISYRISRPSGGELRNDFSIGAYCKSK